MPLRIIRDVAQPWEIALSIGLIALAIAALIWLAGKVYKGGVLQVTARVKLRQALEAR